MTRNWLALAIIIGITLSFVVLWDSPVNNFASPPKISKPLEARQINTLYNSTTKGYTEEGELDYIFASQEARQFQVKRRPGKQDYTELTQPRLQLFDQETQTPWRIVAEEGKATDRGNTITLWGNVRVWQTNDLGETSELQTQYLVVKPEKQYAETDKTVMLISPTGKTQAVGMKANLKTGIIRLLSRVRGIHETQ